MKRRQRWRSGGSLMVLAAAMATGAACGGVRTVTGAARTGTEFRNESAPAGGADAGASSPAPSATFDGPKPGETLEERASRLHRQAIIVDGHNDIPSVLLASNHDLATKSAHTHTDLARMRSGGITGEFFSIYVEGDLAEKPTVQGGGALRRAVDLIDVTYQQIERHPAELMLATSSETSAARSARARSRCSWASRAGTPSRTRCSRCARSIASARAT